MQFLVVVDAVRSHNDQECEPEDERHWPDGVVMGVKHKQQQTEDQYQRYEGIGCADDLAQHRVSPLQDGRTENEIPAKGGGSHHDHQAVQQDA